MLRSAVLEDCALCQETISSSELAAKAREGQFEGQQIHKQTYTEFSLSVGLLVLLLPAAGVLIVTDLLCGNCFLLVLCRSS